MNTMRKKAAFAGINLLLAFSFVLFFGQETSPLWNGFSASGDAVMFALVGRGITEGVLPYKELLENKGPLFFFIQALPQYFIKGTLGIYILQSTVLFAELELMDGLYNSGHGGKRYAYLVKELFLALLSLVYSRGNMAEEYNLFITLLGFYSIKSVFGGKFVHEKFPALILGGGIGKRYHFNKDE